MTIPKPNPERFDMSVEEQMAFWIIIIREYSHKDVRSKSLLLYKNNPYARSDGNAG